MDRAHLGKGASFGAATSSRAFVSSASSPLSYLTEPPSLSAVSDPHVVVSLKNLLKKDSITKTKALEDLLQHVQAHGDNQGAAVDEALLDIWTQLYPRTSIDNSRRVRELSHILQYELIKTVRKRMDRYIPRIVGAWLAGLYDRDRAVARAADNGLSSLLNSPEKKTAIWTKCRAQILEFATQAAQETRDTLSDERSTSSEDADAKYFRVIAASLSLALALVKLDDTGSERSRDKLDTFFAEGVVWKSITFQDSHVRKIASQLLVACLDRRLPYAETAQARQAFITGGLKTDQTGSAPEYIHALTSLTTHKPDIWITNTSDKKPAFRRLHAFIAKGPQGSPSQFWTLLDQLLASVPAEALTLESSSSLLSSLQTGITSRDQHRWNVSSAWKCYTDATRRCLAALAPQDQLTLVEGRLFPLLERLLFPVSDSLELTQSTGIEVVIVDMQLSIMQSSPQLSEALREEWIRVGTSFCSNMSASLPEVSKKYQDSQLKVGKQGHQWFDVVGLLHRRLQDLQNPTADDPSMEPSLKVVAQCISLLESRNLKPFGAARVLEQALTKSPHLFMGDTGQSVARFLQTAGRDFGNLLESPSWHLLLSCLDTFGGIQGHESDYENTWSAWIQEALTLPQIQRDTALAGLVSRQRATSMAQDHAELQDVICARLLVAVDSTEEDERASAAGLLEAAISNKALALESYRRMSTLLVTRLENQSENIDTVLGFLEAFVRANAELFAAQESLRTDLVAQLLAASEIADESTSTKVASIRSILDGGEQNKSSVVGILESNLERANSQSLEIGTMVEQATSAAQTGVSWEQILPNTTVWMAELSPFLDKGINPSLSITSRVGGAMTLPATSSTPSPPRTLSRDRKGRSVPLRMALYTCQLLSEAPRDINVPLQHHAQLLYLVCISYHLVSSQIMCMDRDGLWTSLEEAASMDEAEQFVESCQHLMATLTSPADDTSTGLEKCQHGLLQAVCNTLVTGASQLTNEGAYAAEAMAELLDTWSDASVMDLAESTLAAKPRIPLAAAGFVAGLGERLGASTKVSFFYNRLLSETADASPDSDKTLATLVLLDLCSQVYESTDMPVTTNRVVFAVKQITSWMDNMDKLDAKLHASICRALTQLLPVVKDLYGSWWEATVQFCAHLCRGAGHLPLAEWLPSVHASLGLLNVLEKIEEPNDDLQDALKEFSADKPWILVELLKLPRNEESQPLKVVDTMLCRAVDGIALARIPEPEELFPLLASESQEIQTAVFTMLHKKVPDQQQQESVDVLLDKRDARLPDQLVAVLLNAPTLDKFSDEALALFPSLVRGYLLSWKLLFDAFEASSFKVRSDFTEHIKEGDFVTPLLDFMFDVLGHSAAHPLNLDKEKLGSRQIRQWEVQIGDGADTAEHDNHTAEHKMHWLLVHVFYLVVKYVPGLFKAWYTSCRSRQTRIAVESWTQKYFSPLIIADALNEVDRWAQSQATADDEQPLQIKVLRAAREVSAGYEVDEMQATIVIRVPAAYPLEPVTVAGTRRVAVSERTWQSWMLATQGVIAFSGGSIVDGLLAFRRNVAGALRGQTECAICYSIISADRRMPDKRCSTCKNLFHRSCLYRWFTTSSQNTCPLCRNPIDYLGADTVKRRHGPPEL